jgi:hypothetical protein
VEPAAFVPHFDVTTVDGRRIRYADLWQHRNLVLVFVAGEPAEPQSYAQAVLARARDFEAAETALVVTAGRVAGLPAPGVVVADRWGEIVYRSAEGGAALPGADELLDWVHFVRMQCPECPPS